MQFEYALGFLQLQSKLDEITKKTLGYIVDKYPELVEKYGDFLSSLNIDFDSFTQNEIKIDLVSAEKYIVSLKLQRYIQKLNKDKIAATQLALSGDTGAGVKIREINNELKSANEKLEKLMNIE